MIQTDQLALLDPVATANVLQRVANERARQDDKWGQQDHDPIVWLAILGEEFGEASQESLRVLFDDDSRAAAKHFHHLIEELLQVAAVAVVAVEALERLYRPIIER